MIWIGILLCLGITSSQGKPSGDASDVMPAKELREADDNKPKIFELVSGKKKGEQMFQFSIQKRLSVLVRTEDELNWEEARARCQQLGDELEWTESGLNGDLYHFMTEEDDYKYLDQEKDRELASNFGRIYSRKLEQKNPEPVIEDVWLGKDPRKDRNDSCMYFYGIYGNYVTSTSCKKKFQAFLCEFSGKTEEEEEGTTEEEEGSLMEEEEADGTTQEEEADGTTEEGEADGTTEEDEADGTTEEGEADGTTEEGEADGTTEKGEADGTTEEGEADGVLASASFE